MEKGVQVSVKSGKIVKKDIDSQTDLSSFHVKNAKIQCGPSKGTYNRSSKVAQTRWTYDRLKDEVLCNKENIISWCIKEGLIAGERTCGHCNSRMKLVDCNDRSDGYKRECRRQEKGKRHKVELSIRSGSWFEKSNMSLEEVIQFTYWWCCGIKQEDICHEVNVASHTAVDWDSFCRETCKVTLLEREEKIGGPGKVLEIDESKFGKKEV